MRHATALLALLAFLLVAADPNPCPEPENPTAEAVKRLQGKWDLVKAFHRGMELGKKTEGVTLEVAKDVMTIRDKRDERVTFKLDARKNPPQIDLAGGPKKAILGIYKLEKDEFTLCLGEPGKERPAKIDEKTTRILVFKRKK